MARSLFRDTIMLRGSTGLVPLAGAQVRFYEPGTLVPINFALYADGTTSVTLPVPYVTGPLGELEVWADQPHRVRAIVGVPGYTQADETIDIEPDPAVTASTDDVAGAILAHEAKPDPHPQYLLESEADLLYLPIDYAPPPVPPEYLTEGEAALLYTPLGTAYTKAESDTRYEHLSRKGQPSGYVPLDPSGLVPNQYLPPLAITDAFVVANEAEMLALDAQKGDIAIRADDGISYVLGAEPASEVSNWYAMGGAGAGGNTSIIRDQEWAVSTGNTVTLADTPTDIFTVTRNGVAQSQSLGHFVWAGTTLTFADAFAAGEYITAVYQIGTTSGGGGGGGISQADADLRYVNLDGDTMTGVLVAQDEIHADGGLILNALMEVRSPINFVGDWAVLPDANGRGRIGSVSNRFRWVYSQLGDYDTLNVATKPVVLSPDGGNTLEWRVNGFYSAATAPDLSNYYTKAQADARYEPLDTMYTKVESDARYQPIGSYLTQAAGDLRYEPLDSAYTKAESDAKYALTGSGLTQTAADARYIQLTGGNVLTGSLGPTTSGTRDLGATANAWQTLYAVNVDLISTGYLRMGGTLYASAGTIRLRNTANIAWRNAGNTADLTLGLDASNVLATTAPISTPGPITVGGTVQPKITVNATQPSSPATGDLWIW